MSGLLLAGISDAVSAIPSAALLLAWYDRYRRSLPWRAEPGETPDPYRVWISEIMLQQTTVAAVVPYYEKFVARFPTLAALAAASEAAVMAAWAGLGYYARARNLHACARVVAAVGAFPREPERLAALPGIGRCTAAAIAAIAFDEPVVPVDGNVERVAARVFAIADELPGAKPALRRAAERFAAQPAARARSADMAQALFDLGATVCTEAAPTCGICPWFACCAGRQEGIAAELPRRAVRPSLPRRFGAHFWLTDATGRVLLRRRPPNGLLGGMTELPGTAWRAEPWAPADALALVPMPAPWRPAGQVRHGFTHFRLQIDLYAARVPQIDADGFLRRADALAAEALPALMRKCVRLAQSAEQR